jgi:hypothetical protein
MTAPSLSDQLRAITEGLIPAFGLRSDDPVLLDVKLVLLEAVAVLEAHDEEAKQRSSPDGSTITCFRMRRR